MFTYDSEDELLPCPECKGEGKKYANLNGTLFYCKCTECGFSTITCDNKNVSVTLWNDWSVVNNEWLKSEDNDA